jgi:homoserine dehydrogenase
MEPVKIGLLGIGTVGSGTFRVLQRNHEEITRRAGRRIEIAWVAARDRERARAIVGPDVPIVEDAVRAVADPPTKRCSRSTATRSSPRRARAR